MTPEVSRFNGRLGTRNTKEGEAPVPCVFPATFVSLLVSQSTKEGSFTCTWRLVPYHTLSYIITLSGIVYILETCDRIPKEVLLLLLFFCLVIVRFILFNISMHEEERCVIREMLIHGYMYLPGLDFLCGNQETETKRSEVLEARPSCCVQRSPFYRYLNLSRGSFHNR